MMSDRENQAPESPDEAPKPPVTYASPVKRVWAWVGVVYMLIIVLLFTWYMARAQFMQGIGALMVIPALGGIIATAILRCRSGTGKGGLPVCVLFVAACAGLIVFNLVTGIPALLAYFGG